MPLQINLPVGERNLVYLAVDFLHELRLGDIHVDVGGQLLLLEIFVPVDVGSHCLQLGEGRVVIGDLGITQGNVVERRLGQFRFHAHYGFSGCDGGFLIPSGEFEHGGDVLDVFGAGFLETVFGLQVVVRVGESQAVRADVS